MNIPTTIAEPLERLLRDPFALRRFSVGEYHKMFTAGILKPNDRVELLRGWIVKKMPQNPPHSGSVGRINRRLARVLPEDWSLRVQCPITLSDSEPEPDIVLARGQEGTYDKRHPKAGDIGRLIEVGDATLLDDRRYKSAIYAQARIAHFWLINVARRTVEVYTRPRGGKYQQDREFTVGESIPLILDGVAVDAIPVGGLIARF
jgi:Uma2 family endonuclease